MREKKVKIPFHACFTISCNTLQLLTSSLRSPALINATPPANECIWSLKNSNGMPKAG